MNEIKKENNLNVICHGCLSSDRQTASLGVLSGMFLNLIGNHKQTMIYAADDMKFCYECKAVLRKIDIFQNQLTNAQNLLMQMLYDLYAVVMVLTLLLHLAGFIGGLVNKNAALENTRAQLPSSVNGYSGHAWSKGQWDMLQTQFTCCGVTNATDWLIPLGTEDTLGVPQSCCSHLLNSTCTIHNAYSRGCGDLFMDYITSQMDSIWSGEGFLSLTQGLIVVSVISSLYMVKTAREADPQFRRF